MHFSTCNSAIAVLAVLISSTPVLAQTFTSCNPLTSGNCPPNSALGRSVNIDLTRGASDSFTEQGSPSYGSDGAAFTVAKSGDSPQINSKWYIMFGHVEFVVKAAPGAGIVSSAVLQSDCLDEIDWEWLGGDNGQVQSNYFGKGMTTTYNRGAYHAAPGNHDGFKTYTIDWTSEQIVWQIDGVTVRAMTQANAAEGQYPQTPMMIKVGAWSGGDPANAPGTIAWAGGPTDYSGGPYTMYLRSIAVTDYSTGTQYTYSGSAGTWQSIQSTGGTINPRGGSNTPADTANAPAVTSAAASAPIPFEGTHRDDSSTYVTPSVWPWVGSATATLQTASNYQSSPLQSPSSPGSPSSGPEVVTRWNEQGFPVLVTIGPNNNPSNAPPSYDSRGFLITATAQPSATASAGAIQGTSTGFLFPSAVPQNDGWRKGTAVLRDLTVVFGIEILGMLMVGWV